MSVKHLQYVRVFSLSSLKCLVLALNRHFKPRIALTFISNSVLLYPFFYTCRKSMKATIWSAMVPSHTPQHRTEKRTQNTNWKTVHMLDSTIWWKAEYSHLLEKKNVVVVYSFSNTFTTQTQNSNYFYSAVWQHFLLGNTLPSLFPLLQDKSSYSS